MTCSPTTLTPDDIARMRLALAALGMAVAAEGDGVDEDLAFHCTIAESTGNPVLVQTVRHLGEVARGGIRVTPVNEARRTDFIEAVHQEHHAILAAPSPTTPKPPGPPPASTSATPRPASKRGRTLLDGDRRAGRAAGVGHLTARAGSAGTRPVRHVHALPVLIMVDFTSRSHPRTGAVSSRGVTPC
ncbi:FadR/GntR family transcriptional regulator [Streptomyces griseoluteus]